MPNGLTPKQEAFVAAYIETGNASEAYRRAYDCSGMKDTTINRNAKAMIDHSKISARLTELQQRAAATVVLTRAWVLERLMRNADAAKSAGDYTASNKALELLVKVDELRMFVERSESDNRHHHSAEPVSPTATWASEMLGAGEDRPPKGSLPN